MKEKTEMVFDAVVLTPEYPNMFVCIDYNYDRASGERVRTYDYWVAVVDPIRPLEIDELTAIEHNNKLEGIEFVPSWILSDYGLTLANQSSEAVAIKITEKHHRMLKDKKYNLTDFVKSAITGE